MPLTKLTVDERQFTATNIYCALVGLPYGAGIDI